MAVILTSRAQGGKCRTRIRSWRKGARGSLSTSDNHRHLRVIDIRFIERILISSVGPRCTFFLILPPVAASTATQASAWTRGYQSHEFATQSLAGRATDWSGDRSLQYFGPGSIEGSVLRC